MDKDYIYVQKAEKEDYNELRQIFFNERIENFNWMDPTNIKMEDFDSNTDGEVILTAKINNRIVGFISIWEEDKFIHNLFVASNFKRCGVGKALISACVNLIGLPLTLKCVVANEKALKFYISQGWKIEEKVRGEESYYLMKYDK